MGPAPTHLHETFHVLVGFELICHSSIPVEQSFTSNQGIKGGSLAVATLLREEYPSSSLFQSQLVAELPYPQIFLRKRFVASRTNSFEIRLGPTCSTLIPATVVEFSRSHAEGTFYTDNQVELRSHWWRVFNPCVQFNKFPAFIGWRHGVQRMRVDERGDQGYRHPPYGVLESKATKKKRTD
jgi:hypothetical protein